MQVTTSPTDILTPTAIALGNFDGLHRGHQRVIQAILPDKKGNKSSIYATVVTFNPHPQEFFTGERRPRLTPFREKAQILEQWGIEQLVVLPFDHTLASLSPQDFVETIVVQHLQAKQISVGQDFHFGYKRQGNSQILQKIASQLGITVHIADLETQDTAVRISSSLIRQNLAEGHIPQANAMLGRPYTLWGTVIPGQQLGRKIGFPTANLALPEDKLLPRYGVYGGRVIFPQTQTPVLAAINIGVKPTVAGHLPTVEVHLLDWSGDLYDKELQVELLVFLRPEQKFSRLDDLKSQIKEDCDRLRQIL